jgi:hypothetical protein
VVSGVASYGSTAWFSSAVYTIKIEAAAVANKFARRLGHHDQRRTLEQALGHRTWRKASWSVMASGTDCCLVRFWRKADIRRNWILPQVNEESC